MKILIQNRSSFFGVRENVANMKYILLVVILATVGCATTDYRKEALGDNSSILKSHFEKRDGHYCYHTITAIDSVKIKPGMFQMAENLKMKCDPGVRVIDFHFLRTGRGVSERISPSMEMLGQFRFNAIKGKTYVLSSENISGLVSVWVEDEETSRIVSDTITKTLSRVEPGTPLLSF